VVIVQRDAELLEVVLASGAIRSRANLLERQ
jgi:hypothetical protein